MPPNHAHRRDMTTYLNDNFMVNWRTDIPATADAMADWWGELSPYFDAAVLEYPLAHPDRGVYSRAKTSIQLVYTGLTRVRRDLLSRPAPVVVGLLDQAYTASGVNAVVALPPVPANHQRVWHGNHYLFVNSNLALNATDYGYLYNAMIQDPNSGITTNVGGNLRHQTANATGNTANMIWYTHQYAGNRLLAVSACNPGARTISVIRTGDVNAGVHRF